MERVTRPGRGRHRKLGVAEYGLVADDRWVATEQEGATELPLHSQAALPTYDQYVTVGKESGGVWTESGTGRESDRSRRGPTGRYHVEHVDVWSPVMTRPAADEHRISTGDHHAGVVAECRGSRRMHLRPQAAVEVKPMETKWWSFAADFCDSAVNIQHAVSYPADVIGEAGSNWRQHIQASRLALRYSHLTRSYTHLVAEVHMNQTFSNQ